MQRTFLNAHTHVTLIAYQAVKAAIIKVFAGLAHFRTGTDRHSCCQSNNNGEEGETHYLY